MDNFKRARQTKLVDPKDFNSEDEDEVNEYLLYKPKR
jgi:hypothetical protein